MPVRPGRLPGAWRACPPGGRRLGAGVARNLDGADDGEARGPRERVNRAARELARLLSPLAARLDVTEFVVAGQLLGRSR